MRGACRRTPQHGTQKHNFRMEAGNYEVGNAEGALHYAVFRRLVPTRARALANLASQAIKTGLATKMEE